MTIEEITTILGIKFPQEVCSWNGVFGILTPFNDQRKYCRKPRKLFLSFTIKNYQHQVSFVVSFQDYHLTRTNHQGGGVMNELNLKDVGYSISDNFAFS